MAMHRTCNQCGKIIEDGEPFWSGLMSKVVPMSDPMPSPIPMDSYQLDYHDGHQPDDGKIKETKGAS